MTDAGSSDAGGTGASDPGAGPGDELVEVVDEQGRVTAVVTRREIREGTLRHRATYVVVVDSADRVIVHQRAPWKDVYPLYWDLAFGGVCGVGESWERSATRELAEEAGITGAELQDLGPASYEEDDGRIVLGVSNDRAKWFNAKRQPKVALLVLDGRRQLIVYGTAECIAGEPERAAITRRIRKVVGTNVPADDLSDEDYGKQLDEQKRVIIRITPTSAFSNE